MATDAEVERARALTPEEFINRSDNAAGNEEAPHHYWLRMMRAFAAEENKAMILTIRKRSDMFRAQGRGGLAAELDELADELEAERKREG